MIRYIIIVIWGLTCCFSCQNQKPVATVADTKVDITFVNKSEYKITKLLFVTAPFKDNKPYGISRELLNIEPLAEQTISIDAYNGLMVTMRAYFLVAGDTVLNFKSHDNYMNQTVKSGHRLYELNYSATNALQVSGRWLESSTETKAFK